MDNKLTLKLDSAVIERAKAYARQRNISLSQLIESYLDLLASPTEEPGVTPLVKSLSGVIELPGDFDDREAYRNHVKRKYSA